MSEDSFILSDAGWETSKSSIPHRGIYDYDRVIVAKYSLSEEQQKSLYCFVDKNKPGWTPLVMRKVSDRVFHFSTTFDSSD